jgi:enamine deaminase RidA (YjgF/YER057c/UK114 family)
VDGTLGALFMSGQGAIDANGNLVGEGDFAAQVTRTFDNMDSVLAAGGLAFRDIVKMTVYLTDIANLREFGRLKAERYPGPQPASTAVQVVALALPGMQIEVEATAFR